jgi:DHA1 family multidrug resistance protein-like MFS transporter
MDVTRSLSLEERRGQEQPVVDGDWALDPANPRNWPLARKTVSTAVVTGIGFVSTIAASIYAPGHEAVAKQFGISTTLALLPLSFFNLGMALGPIVSSPMSETFGRKAVYFTTIPTFALFTLGSGFSQSLAALTVCRFFSGVFASPGVSIASATISDMAAPVERAVPLAIYYSMPFIGSLLGFVLFLGYSHVHYVANAL